MLRNFKLKIRQLRRKVAIIRLPVLSHHRTYRSVYGGLLEAFPLIFRFPIIIVSKPKVVKSCKVLIVQSTTQDGTMSYPAKSFAAVAPLIGLLLMDTQFD